jgi:hypothetical protein
MPSLFLLARCVERLVALKLRELEDTMSLLVAIEAKSLVLVSLTLLSNYSSNDGGEINSGSVWRRSATASTIVSMTTTSTKPMSFASTKSFSSALDL